MGESRALVIGAGSIGLRHQRVLSGLGFRADLVSRRPASVAATDVRVHMELGAALAGDPVEHVVIATETTAHLGTLQQLAAADFRGSVLVEKPVSAALSPIPAHRFRAVAVGYQLRHHPAVVAARDAMRSEEVLAVDAYVGQHLAAWRPGRPVGGSASARVEAGGGVLRDLSHELDLVTWLAGPWRRVCAVGGRSGALGDTVRTDDRWGILVELASGAVATLHLNALDHIGQRRLTLVGVGWSVAVDLVTGTLASSSEMTGSALREFVVDRDEVLALMHRALLDGDLGTLCGLEEGMAVVRLVHAVERSVAVGGWVTHEEVS